MRVIRPWDDNVWSLSIRGIKYTAGYNNGRGFFFFFFFRPSRVAGAETSSESESIRWTSKRIVDPFTAHWSFENCLLLRSVSSSAVAIARARMNPACARVTLRCNTKIRCRSPTKMAANVVFVSFDDYHISRKNHTHKLRARRSAGNDTRSYHMPMSNPWKSNI